MVVTFARPATFPPLRVPVAPAPPFRMHTTGGRVNREQTFARVGTSAGAHATGGPAVRADELNLPGLRPTLGYPTSWV